MLLRWRTFFLVAIASFAAKPGRSEEHVHSRQKRGGLLNLDVRLDLFGSNRRQHTTTPQPEGRILPLPPGTEAEDHGAPIKDEAAIQRFISQLESYRKRNSGLDSIPILGGVVKKVRRFQACATPKLEKGHCRHVQHCVLPAFLRNINILLSYACFIGGAHLGVCCPDRHFDESIVVDDDDEEPPTTTKRPGLLDGLVNPLKDIISPNRPDRPDKPSRPDVPEVPDGPSELEPGEGANGTTSTPTEWDAPTNAFPNAGGFSFDSMFPPGPRPFRRPHPPRFPRPPGHHRPPFGRPDYFPPDDPFAGFQDGPFGGNPHRGPPHGRPHGPPHGPPHGRPHGRPHGPPHEHPHGRPHGPHRGPQRGPPHGHPHRPPHGPHRDRPHGEPPFIPHQGPHREPPHQGRPSYEPDYYPDPNQGTSNGRPSEGLTFTTELPQFPTTTFDHDRAEVSTTSDGSPFTVSLPATAITDFPFTVNTAITPPVTAITTRGSTGVHTISTVAGDPGEATTEWSKEPSYEDDKRPVVVSPPPVTYPPTKSTTTTTTTQAPETPQQADGSQITKYSSTCGLSIKSRIVGGEVANKELWSWIAALMKLDKRTNQMEQFCGGVVISNRYIVTAAHCLPGIHPRDLTIRLGEFDFTQKDNNRRQDFRVSRIVRHPHFNETNNNFADIALVKVNRDIAFNRDLLPVCMPEEESYADKQATVVGWGVTSFGGPSSNILMQLSLPVWANSECQEKLNTVVIHPEFLCAGLKDRGGHDSCQGDSGGPLMVENSNMQWSLVGIVSWGFKCAQKGIPAVYTRVTEYRDWIYRNAA